jgi:hypothetical protein
MVNGEPAEGQSRSAPSPGADRGQAACDVCGWSGAGFSGGGSGGPL